MKRRMRFGTWCKKDVNDTRKINYTLKTYENEVLKFTSEEEQPYSMIVRLRNAWIETIELINNEWFVLLYED
jgi:hypothetical protein